KSIFIMGSTGFLGKVCLAMLLDSFPNIRRVYVMVRAGSGTTSEKRFHKDVVGSPVFDPLRERFGEATLEGLVAEKVRVVGGDITHDNLGYSDEEAQAIAQDIDIIINSSGKVTFNPALDQSLRTNVNGTKNVLAFAKRMKVPRLVHVSTCFVAGNKSGPIWENVPVEGYFPRQDDLEGASFSAEQEIADCANLAERVREEAKDSVLSAELRLAARVRLREEGRDPDNDRYQRLAQARERKNWVRSRLTDLGIERAERWGWPNIYCYAKSLAEQLVAAEEGIVRTIIRPSIVESSLSFPFPGWNEGFTTSAPIIFLALKGQNIVPCSQKLILDIIPVDYVSGGVLMAAAQAMVEQPPLVYQLASGDANPLRMQQMVTLLGLHKREHFQKKADEGEGNSVLNEAIARMEVQTKTFEEFERSSVPMFRRMAERTTRFLDKLRPSWGGPTVADILDRAKSRVERVEQVTKGVEDVFEMYRPFIGENHYVFRCDNVRAAQERVPPEERHLAPWAPDTLDWHHYMMRVHFEGLHKWVLPELEADFAAQPKHVYTYNHLVELFETSSKLHATRVAMRMERGGHRDQYTYAEVHELATRAAGFLRERGIEHGDRVMLLSENRPEWAMTYFGVLKAGGICVPIDKESTAGEVENLARAGHVKALCVSEKQLDEREGLRAALEASGVAVYPFAELYELP
ncbi:MAG: SDR family oxidoreductase, partial [Myxococcales bacterium]|nr:SDR family oxidoreductase [Myxococcales bacterium]